MARPYGGPREFLTLRDEDGGIYIHAGAPHEDGALPYLWMTWTCAEVLSGLRPAPKPDRAGRPMERTPPWK